MDQHDQELLDKQLRSVASPPPQAGLVAMAIVAIFLIGVIAGSVLTAATASQASAPDSSSGPAVAFLDTGAPITRN